MGMVVSPSTSVNVVFCVDVTGSMEWLIEAVRDGIEKVAGIYLSSRLDMQVGLVQFRDKVYAKSEGNVDFDPIAGWVHPTMLVTKFSDGETLTSNIDEFTSAVSSLTAQGGGDEPESSFDAIAAAATLSNWSKAGGSTKVIVHMTDAPPVIPDVEIQDCEQLRQVLTQSEIDQVFIIAPNYTHAYYEELSLVERRPGDFALVSFHDISSDVDQMVRILEEMAKTSSDSILTDDVEEPYVHTGPSENPFDVEDDSDDDIVEGLEDPTLMREDLDDDDDDDDDDNPFE